MRGWADISLIIIDGHQKHEPTTWYKGREVCFAADSVISIDGGYLEKDIS